MTTAIKAATYRIDHDDFVIVVTPCDQLQGDEWVDGLSCKSHHRDGRVYSRFLPYYLNRRQIIADYLENRFRYWWQTAQALS